MMNLKTVNVRRLFVAVIVSMLLLLSMLSSAALLLPNDYITVHSYNQDGSIFYEL